MNREVLNYLNEGAMVIDRDYNIRYINQALLERIGYQLDELLMKESAQILKGDIALILNTSSSERDKNVEITLYNDHHHEIKVTGGVFQGEWEEEGVYFIIIKAYEEPIITIREMESVLENMPYAIWISDENDQYRYTNTNTLTMVNQLGATNQIETREALLEQHPEEVYRETLNKRIFKEDQAILRKGIMINEERVTAHYGENLQYQIIKVPLFNEAQKYQGYIGISQYNILKQEVDIAKVIEGTNPDLLMDSGELYDQLVASLEFSPRAASIFQGRMFVILKYDKSTDQLQEIGRWRKGGKHLIANTRLSIKGSSVLELVENNKEWELSELESHLSCTIEEEQFKGATYIRINPIEYNGELMGVIFTTYESKLKYPLMDSCIIDKLCQHLAIIFKSLEYSLDLRRELMIREELEAERGAYKQALQLETLKSEFLANMSHELKTPLSILYSSLQMFELEIKTLQTEQDIASCIQKLEYYKGIEKQNIFRLLRLINNITDMSKMGAGYYQVNLVNCDIVRVIEDITMSVVEYVKNKELSIIFDTEVEELVMACDPEKIERIMLNLLSNAVKYTHKGDEIEVTLHIEEGHLLGIRVRDSGIGIPQERQKMIFERFAQVDSSFTRKCEGSGIGLALVKSLVEVQGGRIQVESQVGEGSCFYVQIPIRAVQEPSHVEEPLSIDPEKEEMLIHKCRIEFSDIYDL